MQRSRSMNVLFRARAALSHSASEALHGQNVVLDCYFEWMLANSDMTSFQQYIPLRSILRHSAQPSSARQRSDLVYQAERTVRQVGAARLRSVSFLVHLRRILRATHASHCPCPSPVQAGGHTSRVIAAAAPATDDTLLELSRSRRMQPRRAGVTAGSASGRSWCTMAAVVLFCSIGFTSQVVVLPAPSLQLCHAVSWLPPKCVVTAPVRAV